ncbi:hypothetical protein ABS71_09515 [bacterium SCN 62-11]|nr:type II secretion system F family protein [Candidatus Eremiobacteraeota bacterium]ODT68695.1 MAG: hypothetical protein ABS71_09515 [bacterium SCN 62-11]
MTWLQKSAHFTRDLHLLLQAGASVPEALTRIHSRADGRWAESLRQARDAAASGDSLTQALRRGNGFPPLLVSGLESAEDDLSSLLRLSELLERSELRRSQTATVLAYPLLLLTAGTLLVFLISSTLGQSIPNLLSGMKLPLLSRIVLEVLAFFANPLVLLGLLTSAGLMGWVLWGPSPRAARLRMKLPLIGSWLWRSEAANWLDWIDHHLGHGRPLPEALRRGALACQDPAFRLRAEAAAGAVERGADLTKALTEQKLLSELALWLVSQAQAQEFPLGRLACAARLLERELQADAEGGLACLEICGLLAVVALVFPLLLSIFLPLFQTIEAIGE